MFVSVCGRRWIPQNATLSLSAKKSYYKKSFSNYSANITYPAVRISASTSSSSPSTLCLYTNLLSGTLVFPFIQNERTVYFKDRQTTESFAKKQHHWSSSRPTDKWRWWYCWLRVVIGKTAGPDIGQTTHTRYFIGMSLKINPAWNRTCSLRPAQFKVIKCKHTQWFIYYQQKSLL